MNQGQTIFSQIIDFLPKKKFRQCVNRYSGNHRIRSFTCYNQFLCMAFAQLAYRESLRDIECCLRAMREKLYHMGIRGKVSRSTLADANEIRDWRIYSDFAQVLIHEARRLYVDDDFGLELKETVYALDSSTIDLCLSVFPWARFRKTKAAVKLHTLLDLRGDIPTFIWITDGKVHDVNVLDHLIPEPGAIYIMDRAYLDFKRLYQMHQSSAVFVTRSKTNTGLRRIYSHKVDKTTGVRCDQTVVPTGFYSKKDYPEKLRRIKYFDAEKGRSFHFPYKSIYASGVNDHRVVSIPVASGNIFQMDQTTFENQKVLWHIRKCCQNSNMDCHLNVCSGCDIMKKRLKTDLTLYTILQILSITLFEKKPIYQVLTDNDYTNKITSGHIQLKLFDS